MQTTLLFAAIVRAEPLIGASEYPNDLFPAGVSIGMDGERLRQLRQHAISIPPASGAAKRGDDYDSVEQIGPATVVWYYARGGRLRGCMRTTKAITLSPPTKEEQRKLIMPPDGSGFVKEGTEEALRVGRELQILTIAPTKWRQTATGLALYTVTTEQEITAILFDEHFLPKETFFISPKLKSDVAAHVDSVKQAEARQGKTKLDRGSDPQTGRSSIPNRVIPLTLIALVLLSLITVFFLKRER